MIPKITYFYHKGCQQCKDLAPIIKEFQNPLNINLVDTYSDNILMEENKINWVPTIVLEDQNGKHKFEGPNEVREFLKKIVL
jgi:thioredoxin-like negative regulator of GroEL